MEWRQRSLAFREEQDAETLGNARDHLGGVFHRVGLMQAANRWQGTCNVCVKY